MSKGYTGHTATHVIIDDPALYEAGSQDAWRKLYTQEWPIEAVPADLAMCNKCRRVVGNHREKYGRECECEFRAKNRA